MPGTSRVTVFAPGSVGNVGPGLDILGLALTGAGDRVTAERTAHPGITILDPGHPDLPTDPDRHAAGIAAAAVLAAAGDSATGLALRCRKELPLAGGQGGSAASALAGAVAANLLVGAPLDAVALLLAALASEERLAGRHADNIAPILLGGIVLVRSLDPVDVVALPVPAALRVVLAHPAQRMTTAEARAVLPATVPRGVAMYQAAQVAAMVAALASGDLALLGRALDDRIAEPARAERLPGFLAAKAAALEAGALGSSISGAGPTAFALADGDESARRVAAAMAGAYRRAGVDATTRIAAIDERGARAEPDAREERKR